MHMSVCLQLSVGSACHCVCVRVRECESVGVICVPIIVDAHSCVPAAKCGVCACVGGSVREPPSLFTVPVYPGPHLPRGVLRHVPLPACPRDVERKKLVLMSTNYQKGLIPK